MTFHCFPRLPADFRMRIWELSAAEYRVLRFCEQRWPRRNIWSPTPAPPVTRASREARKHCKYQQFFVIEGSPRFIWTCFENDRIQMSSSLMAELSKGSSDGKKNIRHLRLQLDCPTGLDESESFFYKNMYCIRGFPSLQSCETPVNDLLEWGKEIVYVGWGACPKSGVRFVDKETGEYITAKNSGAYVDWIETQVGTLGYFMSVRDEDWNED